MAETLEERLLLEAEQAWNDAILQQDVKAAHEFMAADCVLVGSRLTGPPILEHRDSWLKGLAAMRVHSYRTQVVRTRLYDDCGVVSVVGSWQIVFEGREILENFFLTDIWTESSNGWKVVLRHFSPYPT